MADPVFPAALADDTVEVLEKYSQGTITWRKASSLLMLDKFEQLEALMHQAGLTMHVPDEAKDAEKVHALKTLFVGEIRKADPHGQ